ncbi:MAG TPA: hypothetical protein ENG73_06930 [Desulfobacterales bacterium]|nr:hypothetical protein [Desulfobacterales bacterium]
MREGVKVGDLSVEELKALIKEVLLEVMDPDYGLELRPEVEKALLQHPRVQGRSSSTCGPAPPWQNTPQPSL